MEKKLKLITGIALLILVIAAAVVVRERLKNSAIEAETETEEEAVDVYEVGEKAADFTCLNADKEEVKLSDYFGKPIVMNFWATWCPPCCSELGYFDEMYKEYGQDIQFIMLDLTDGSYETIEDVEAFVKENEYKFPVFYDTEEEGVRAYNIDAIPQTFFITADGEITTKYVGSMTEDVLESELNKLLGK